MMNRLPIPIVGVLVLVLGLGGLVPPTATAKSQPAKQVPTARLQGDRILVSPGRLSFSARGHLKKTKTNANLVAALASFMGSRPDLKRVRVEGHGAADGRPEY